MINRVTITGDIVEVEKEINGEISTIRRHVDGYYSLSDQEKQKLWHDIAREPFIEYLRDPVTPEIHKESIIDKLTSFFKLK